MKSITFEEAQLLLEKLCRQFEPKLSYAHKALKYSKVGEFVLAIEFLSDWLIDETPEIKLSSQDFMLFRQVAQILNTEKSWIDLLCLVSPDQINLLPIEVANQADSYLKNEKASNPQRAIWLNRIEEIVKIMKEVSDD